MTSLPLVLFLLFTIQSALASDNRVPARESRYGPKVGTRTHFAIPQYASLEEWKSRSEHLQKQILSSAGLFPMPEKNPLRPERRVAIERDGYRIERVWLETMPGFRLAGNLYLPAKRNRSLPAVLIAHGHWKHGRIENLDVYSVPALGINLARQGYVAFAYDMVGYNDTRQLPHEFGDHEEHQAWAFNSFGVQLWNSIRAVDFVSSLNEVDSARIAITGASGGGTQSFFLAAIDPRIRAVAPVNMVSAQMQGGCRCENAPGLRVGTCNPELAALAAPRPMLLVSSTQDWTKETPVVEFPAIRKIYELFGSREMIDFVQIDAEHNYNRESRMAVYQFLDRHLKQQRFPAAERGEIAIDFDTADLLWKPEAHEDMASVFQQWKSQAEFAIAAMGPQQRKAALQSAIGAEWPRLTRFSQVGDRVTLGRHGFDDIIPGLWLNPNRPDVTLIVSNGSADESRKHERVKQMIERGESVMLVDVFETGSARSEYGGGKYFLTFHRSVDALRVQDILTALAYLAGRTTGTIRLAGLGDADIWAATAASVLPSDVAGRIRLLRHYDGEHEPEKLSVPGIERAGGVRMVQKLAVQVRPPDAGF